jgi:hypothetical protein
MGRHGGNDPKKVPGAQGAAPLFLYNLYILKKPYLALTDYKKPVCIGFALNYNV